MTILRQGERRTIEVEIGRLPEEEMAAADQGEPSQAPGGPLGLRVEPLPDQLASRLDVPGGVLVTDVGRGPAFQAGIRRNDVITELNRQPVTSVDQFRDVVGDLPEDRAVSVRIIREGRATYLVMRP